MNIIPFDQTGSLPSYLKNIDRSALNSDLASGAAGGFPAVSIKGKVFAIVRDNERKILPNPKDPDSAATSIDVVLIKAGKGKSKVFYLKGYDKDSSEGQKPDCYSNDGVAPAADAQNPQSSKCATCKHDQWGSRVSESGNSKGKACSDTKRLAIAASGLLNDPMLLRVPPASLKSLQEYGSMLSKRGVSHDMVVTKIGFDMEAESPKLTFRPVGFLDDAAYAEVKEVAQSEIVSNIIGSVVVGDPLAPALEAPEAAPVEEAPAPKPKAEAKAKVEKKPEPKAPTPVVEDDSDIDFDLDGISFDD